VVDKLDKIGDDAVTAELVGLGIILYLFFLFGDDAVTAELVGLGIMLYLYFVFLLL
jgi:hypothetical protein